MAIWGRLFVAACGFLALAPAPLLAEATGRPARDSQVRAAVTEASRLGELLYNYDQTAWHATDRMLEGFDEALAPLMRGYIVLPGRGGALDAVFYGEVEGKLVEMARFAVRRSEVVNGGWLPATARPALSPEALRLVAARQAAMEYAAREKLSLCAQANPNIVVLPPSDQNRVVVYILTPPVETNAYPLGGHYRMEVDAAGKVVASRNFMNSCMSAQTARGPDGAQAVGMVVSHLLDDHPTEIHAFASRNVPLSLYVMTVENKAMWTVENGRIRYTQQIPE